MSASLRKIESPWPHRWAVLLTCATFPLIWVGGLVTTLDAGMSVPDWPGTYGYNLFLYPWRTWFFGPWDLFIEHGHRLLGSLAGLLTICLTVSVFCCDSRRWMRWAVLSALGLVIFQGVLGGLRVVLDQRTLALAHGCTGPLFFTWAAALCLFTSRAWKTFDGWESDAATAIQRIARITWGLVYLQLILGALLRHIPAAASHQFFRIVVLFHLLFALLTTIHIISLAMFSRRGPVLLKKLSRVLCLLVLCQVALGVGTWVSKYAWPWQLGDYGFAAGYVVQAKSFSSSLIITSHVAVGSLLLAFSGAAALASGRLIPSVHQENRASVSRSANLAIGAAS